MKVNKAISRAATQLTPATAHRKYCSGSQLPNQVLARLTAKSCLTKNLSYAHPPCTMQC